MEPNTLFGDDSRPDTRPLYLYAVAQLDIADAPTLYLTGHDQEIDVSGMPGSYGADDPQAFLPAQISHGPIRREGTFDKSTFEITALTRDISGISRYALTGAVPRIRVDIIKVNPGPVIAGEPAEWGTDTLVVQTGLMARFGFSGFGIAVECVPEPLFSDHEIPRWRFSRTCNRQLYAPDCGVVAADFELVTNILAVDPAMRTLTLQGTHPSDTGDFFRQGVLLHQPTGMRLSVFSSTLAGADTVVRLHQWSPDFEIGDVAIARAGCRHSLGDCRDKFSNAAAFGGFSEVPNKNPTLHGM